MIKKKCIICKKNFLTYQSKFFCSRKCYQQFHKGKRETKKCLVCGNKFVSLASRCRKFCSRKCFDKKKKETMLGNKYGFKKGFIPWNKGLIGYDKGTFQCGKNHPNWKGGTTFYPYPFEWNFIRKKIIERDENICKVCGKSGNNVHHKDSNKKNCREDNLITLCPSCHLKVHWGKIPI